jgi:hypothetical protein
VRRGIDGGPTGPGERDTKPVWQRWVPGLREGGGAGYVVASSCGSGRACSTVSREIARVSAM